MQCHGMPCHAMAQTQNTSFPVTWKSVASIQHSTTMPPHDSDMNGSSSTNNTGQFDIDLPANASSGGVGGEEVSQVTLDITLMPQHQPPTSPQSYRRWVMQQQKLPAYLQNNKSFSVHKSREFEDAMREHELRKSMQDGGQQPQEDDEEEGEQQQQDERRHRKSRTSNRSSRSKSPSKRRHETTRNSDTSSPSNDRRHHRHRSSSPSQRQRTSRSSRREKSSSRRSNSPSKDRHARRSRTGSPTHHRSSDESRRDGRRSGKRPSTSGSEDRNRRSRHRSSSPSKDRNKRSHGRSSSPSKHRESTRHRRYSDENNTNKTRNSNRRSSRDEGDDQHHHKRRSRSHSVQRHGGGGVQSSYHSRTTDDLDEKLFGLSNRGNSMVSRSTEGTQSCVPSLPSLATMSKSSPFRQQHSSPIAVDEAVFAQLNASFMTAPTTNTTSNKVNNVLLSNHRVHNKSRNNYYHNGKLRSTSASPQIGNRKGRMDGHASYKTGNTPSTASMTSHSSRSHRSNSLTPSLHGVYQHQPPPPPPPLVSSPPLIISSASLTPSTPSTRKSRKTQDQQQQHQQHQTRRSSTASNTDGNTTTTTTAGTTSKAKKEKTDSFIDNWNSPFTSPQPRSPQPKSRSSPSNSTSASSTPRRGATTTATTTSMVVREPSPRSASGSNNIHHKTTPSSTRRSSIGSVDSFGGTFTIEEESSLHSRRSSSIFGAITKKTPTSNNRRGSMGSVDSFGGGTFTVDDESSLHSRRSSILGAFSPLTRKKKSAEFYPPRTPSPTRNKRGSITELFLEDLTISGIVKSSKKSSVAASEAATAGASSRSRDYNDDRDVSFSRPREVMLASGSIYDDYSCYTDTDSTRHTVQDHRPSYQHHHHHDDQPYPVITTKDLEIQLLNLMDAIETRENHIVQGVEEAIQEINNRLKLCEEASKTAAEDASVLREINERLKRCEEVLNYIDSEERTT